MKSTLEKLEEVNLERDVKNGAKATHLILNGFVAKLMERIKLAVLSNLTDTEHLSIVTFRRVPQRNFLRELPLVQITFSLFIKEKTRFLATDNQLL